ncbi:MAG: hypothetical protein ABSB79_10740, partial [Syntrophales bacterium]
SGRLPHGAVGEVVCRQLDDEGRAFMDAVSKYRVCDPIDPKHFKISAGPCEMTGTLDGIYTANLLRFRYAALKPKDHIDMWLAHLVLNSIGHMDDPRESLLIGKDEGWRFIPVEHPEVILEHLLSIYWNGLMKDIHFFPMSAWRYVEDLRKGKPSNQALRMAAGIWEGNEFSKGEGKNAYCELFYGCQNPLDESFEMLARQILEPLMDHREVI